MSIPKTFLRAFVLATTEPTKSKKYLTDRRLSFAEKIILEGYLRLRSSDFNWIIDHLSGLNTHSGPVECIRFLVLGISYNNSGNPKVATKLLETALAMPVSKNYPEIEFLILYNTFVANQNLPDLQKLHALHVRLMEFKFPKLTFQWFRQQRVHFAYCSIFGRNTEAHKIIMNLKEHEDSLDEFQRLAWVIDKIRFFAKEEKFELCFEELKNLKSLRSFYLTEDYKFIKATLELLSNDAPLYLYERDFSEISLLRLQINVLLSLEEKNINTASNAWKKLQELSPTCYQDEFEYAGEECLFSLCVKKLLRDFKISQQRNEINLLSCTTKEEKLYQLLVHNPTGVAKAELIHILWGQPSDSKSDFKKLSKLLERVKIKYGLEVISRKGTYIVYLNEVNKKQA